MKKIISFALAAVALVFTACSNDETIETSGNGQNNKGMVLVATVSQQGSCAAIDASETFGKWTFTFNDKDNVVVGNSTINDYYTFTKSDVTFSSADAKMTSSAADWYAYYPATTFDLTDQEGTPASAAKLYALAGATTTATTGADGLTIDMKAQAAVLRIVKVDNYGPCDIYLKTADGKYVSGLNAKKNEAGYDVVKSDDKVSVFTKARDGNAGIYYVIVPAGVKISVYNSDKLIKTTKDSGLKAGNYYTLTSGPTTGTAEATINGKTETIKWVQLWIGGPRIATENVDKEMSWIDATKPGDKYVWGKNWRTPSEDELDIVAEDGGTPKHVEVKLSTDNGVKHFKYKGTQPGYTSNEMIIPFTKGQNEAGVYWTSSTDGKLNTSGQLTGTSLTVTDWYGQGIINYFSNHSERHIHHSVRPVLNINIVEYTSKYNNRYN